ncbi:ATPase inhibitor subunit zeta [Nereida sp. MMG025]|uniref:ATPase inhibitor subunit zeta n=1 Tax=Nereida sp. MMG025 TaxID=2909981 RepID=UPI001F35ADB2|nr:ATPase inhibitor subunit zeta [Nereida sp. MMG025]MCF6443173.1 ATPase inhibitor subunit zeta [Nereida sp. MMG025]
MTFLKGREHAFESQFALDADAEFRQRTAKHRAAGLWAAALMDHPAPDAYAAKLVKLGMQPHGERDIFDKLHADLNDLTSIANIRCHLSSPNGDTIRQA